MLNDNQTSVSHPQIPDTIHTGGEGPFSDPLIPDSVNSKERQIPSCNSHSLSSSVPSKSIIDDTQVGMGLIKQ